MDEKRPIDRKRESAGSISIGTADDKSAIVEMISMNGVMYVVTEKSIYSVNLADDIDPKRENPNVPWAVQQQILARGASDELVGRTLLTVKNLFDSPYLAKKINRSDALLLSLDVLKDLVSMRDEMIAFKADEEAAFSSFQERVRQNSPFVLPAIVDVSQRCKTAIQKADHALQGLFGIVKLFYDDEIGKKWFDSLHALLVKKIGADHEFSRFVYDVIPSFKFIRNMRNCVEHPKPEQRIEVLDFRIRSATEICPPTIEVVHPDTAQPPVFIPFLFEHLVDQMSSVFEVMCAFLCTLHVEQFAGFQFQVVEIPEIRRQNKNVRFGYGTEMDGRLVIAS